MHDALWTTQIVPLHVAGHSKFVDHQESKLFYHNIVSMNTLNSTNHTMSKLICYITCRLQRHAHTYSDLAKTPDTSMFVYSNL